MNGPSLARPRMMIVSSGFASSVRGYRGLCEDLADHLSTAGYSVITTSHQQGRITRLLDMVASVWIQQRQYDLVQIDVYSGWAFNWAEAVARSLRLLKKPYILTLHGGNLPEFAQSWPNRVKALLRSANTVTTPSEYLRHHLIHLHDAITLLPNPLDLKTYSFQSRTVLAPHLIWVRSFHEVYRPQTAVHVIAGLIKDYPEATLAMVGPDKGDGTLQQVKQLANHYNLEDHITIIGGVDHSDIPLWLGTNDIFINTTSIDNTPLSLLEAMACGLAVVSTNVGGIPFLLTDKHDALLVPPDNPEAMIAAIRRLLADPDLGPHLISNARHKVSQFDWAQILPQWEALIQQTARPA